MALCSCGCGMETPIARQTRPERGVVAGQSMRFVHGHNGRKGGILDRFYAMVNAIPGGCWEWTGGKNAMGYGIFNTGGARHKVRSVLAHRLSWWLSVGDFESKLYVLHKCDNPGCVNPAHLYIGTAIDNANDRSRRGAPRRGNLPFGVYARDGRFRARVRLAGATYELGTFDTAEEASVIAVEAKTMYLDSLDMMEAANAAQV